MADTEKTAMAESEAAEAREPDVPDTEAADRAPVPGLIGRKVGMTQVFEPDGRVVPVTVVRAEPNVVLRARSRETDGYAAVQVGAETRKPKHTSRPLAGYFQAQGVEPRRIVKEFRVPDASRYQIGDQLTVDMFQPGTLVDVTATTKGKGFQGVLKRHNFSGGADSHGSKTGRMPGSIGQSADPSEVLKGRKLPGRMGGARLTVRNLKVVGVDPEASLIWLMGAVPGSARAVVMLRPAIAASERRRRHAAGMKIEPQQKKKGGPIKKKK
jgi:large subunit ribosomal protein L3